MPNSNLIAWGRVLLTYYLLLIQNSDFKLGEKGTIFYQEILVQVSKGIDREW
jgi:hypothetical protein